MREAKAGQARWRSPGVLTLIGLVILGLGATILAVTNTATPDELYAPGCTTKSASAPLLGTVQLSYVSLPDAPDAVATIPGWTFVSTGTGHSVQLLRTSGGLAPEPARTVDLGGPAEGEAVSPDGRYLLVASGSGAYVLNMGDAERGGTAAVAGALTSPGGSGASEVALSRDGRFAFVTLRNSGTVAVFDLRSALASGLQRSGYVGSVPVGVGPDGIALSADGNWLYVATTQQSKGSVQGALSLVSVARAETQPGSADEYTVAAGCQPGQIIATGSVVWVTAQGSNALLGYSAAQLSADPLKALIAVVKVGQDPVGLTAVQGGKRILVANSNQQPHSGATASLGVVDASAALAGKPALTALIPAGLQPSEFAVEPGGQVILITDSGSRQLEAVDVSGLH